MKLLLLGMDKKLFLKLKKGHENFESTRHQIIQDANSSLHRAKQAIFSLHRDDSTAAGKNLAEIEKSLSRLQSLFKNNPKLEQVGAYKAALEEYVEAKLFWQALKLNTIREITAVKVDFDDYLAGICDLTGELVRKIVLYATKRKVNEAQKLKNLIDEIIGELIKFDLTGYLRTKYDDAKRNLKKAEEILYDLAIRRK